MSSSSAWSKVIAGARLVASATVKQASDEAAIVANRAAHHGMDLSSKARASSQELWKQTTVSVNGNATGNGDASGNGNGNVNVSGNGAYNPYESQLRKSTKEEQQPPASKPVVNGSHQIHETPQTETKISKADAPNPYLLHAPKIPVSDDELDKTIKPVQQERDPSTTLDPPVETDMDMDTAAAPSLEKSIAASENIIRQPLQDNDAGGNTRLKEGRAIPATRFGRAFGFASLGASLAAGTVSEVASRLFKGGKNNTGGSPITNDANADRLAATLCRMRGAALKMGQMLSIQDESMLPPALVRALQQVRQGADAMPNYQVVKQLTEQLGLDWRDKFESFDETPFAAASIGQVHRATIRDPSGTIRDVVVKVQYPGVASSIESDLRNLTMLVTMTGLAPKGLFIENVIRVGRDELQVECNYINEMANQRKFKELVGSDPVLVRNGVVVPDVIEHLTTEQVITSEYSPGGTIDKVSNMDQEERDRIGRTILYLAIKELFDWRFMQTDPNWGNFLYDVGTRQTTLIDFGATREYSKEFVDGYLRVVWASANRDEETLMAQSRRMGFLTGEENDAMLHAHKMSGFTVGEPFWTDEPFDFRGSEISTRMGEHTSVFLKHRLT
jgi:aarF domain-containing kinase